MRNRAISFGKCWCNLLPSKPVDLIWIPRVKDQNTALAQSLRLVPSIQVNQKSYNWFQTPEKSSLSPRRDATQAVGSFRPVWFTWSSGPSGSSGSSQPLLWCVANVQWGSYGVIELRVVTKVKDVQHISAVCSHCCRSLRGLHLFQGMVTSDWQFAPLRTNSCVKFFQNSDWTARLVVGWPHYLPDRSSPTSRHRLFPLLWLGQAQTGDNRQKNYQKIIDSVCYLTKPC